MRSGVRSSASANGRSCKSNEISEAALLDDDEKVKACVFFDVTELDPGKGAAIYGGVGVGEQYASATWEDRATRLSGPALSVKDAARRYLKATGFTDDEIPAPLRPLPGRPDYDARVKELEAAGWTATAMEVHNDRGFAQKDASITSAVLYTLMRPGSLIMVPDSIWTHELWAAQLLGAALRGCHVYVIAPAQTNAPSAGFPQLSRTRELWSRFLEAQRILGPEIAERAFSCRGRSFCPSCEQKKQLLWAEWLREEVLAPVAHRHVVLTVPRLLRPLIRRRRDLLIELARAGAEATV